MEPDRSVSLHHPQPPTSTHLWKELRATLCHNNVYSHPCQCLQCLQCMQRLQCHQYLQCLQRLQFLQKSTMWLTQTHPNPVCRRRFSWATVLNRRVKLPDAPITLSSLWPSSSSSSSLPLSCHKSQGHNSNLLRYHLHILLSIKWWHPLECVCPHPLLVTPLIKHPHASHPINS